MGLLDDLKKQAEMVKTQQVSQETLREDALKLVEDKMKQTFQYLNDLLKQLAVLKPANPLIFSVPGVAELKDLQFMESFIDYRKKRLSDQDLFDLTSFYIKWGSPNKLVLERDMPATAQKVRDALIQNGLKFGEEEVRNERGVVSKWKFTIESSIVTDVKIRADHDNMRLLMRGKNLIRLGSDDFVVPAPDINEAWLEDFAKTLLGQLTNFRKYRLAAPLK